ncbi:hypothetical protein J1N35_031948 [Gossypium stocksii]|uniref:Uncharacterized protein n=1 Tax=Gossypium stocksii TaxID=47602 RepID=A0A9D3V2E7_9ROSI|nr:hypothetical protein J1N35_031948 [Gossypium stocksii]
MLILSLPVFTVQIGRGGSRGPKKIFCPLKNKLFRLALASVHVFDSVSPTRSLSQVLNMKVEGNRFLSTSRYIPGLGSKTRESNLRPLSPHLPICISHSFLRLFQLPVGSPQSFPQLPSQLPPWPCPIICVMGKVEVKNGVLKSGPSFLRRRRKGTLICWLGELFSGLSHSGFRYDCLAI